MSRSVEIILQARDEASASVKAVTAALKAENDAVAYAKKLYNETLGPQEKFVRGQQTLEKAMMSGKIELLEYTRALDQLKTHYKSTEAVAMSFAHRMSGGTGGMASPFVMNMGALGSAATPIAKHNRSADGMNTPGLSHLPDGRWGVAMQLMREAAAKRAAEQAAERESVRAWTARVRYNSNKMAADPDNQNPGGHSGFAGRLEGWKKGLREFNSLFELGLGAGVGVKFFEQIHHGAVRAAEGFGDAISQGKSFADSIDEGARAMMGFKTNTQLARDATDAFLKSRKELIALSNQAQESFATAIGLPPAASRFPNLADPKAAETTLALMREGVKKAAEAARPAQDELTKAQSQEALLGGLRSNIFTRGSANFREALPGWLGLGVVDESSADVRRRNRGVLGNLGIAEMELADYEKQLKEKDTDARRKSVRDVIGTAGRYTSNTLNSFPDAINAGKSWYGGMFDKAESKLGELAGADKSKIVEQFKNQYGLPVDERDKKRRMLERIRPEIGKEHFAYAWQQIDEEYDRAIRKPGKKEKGGGGSSHWDATESRYLTRGTGALDPSLLELKAGNKHWEKHMKLQEKLIKRLEAIERKMKPLAAANIV